MITLPFSINLQSKTAKIVFVLIFLILSFAIGFGLYYVFFKKPITEVIPQPQYQGGLPQASVKTPPTYTPITPGTLPESALTPVIKVPAVETPQAASITAQGGITKVNYLSYNSNMGSALSGDGNNLVSYDKNDGKFYITTSAGQRLALSDKTFYNVENVTWSSSANKAIMQYPDGSNIYYDFEKEKQVTLPKTWTSFDFFASQEKIAFKEISSDPDRNWLSVANPDGTGKTKIEPMGSNGDRVDVNVSPTAEVVALYNEPGGTNKSTVYLIGQNGENFKGLAVKGMGFESQWSPTGEKMVYSVYSDETGYKPELWITDAQGDNIGRNNQSLQLNTWSYKCTFQSTDYMYCGVPAYLDTGAGLQPSLSNYIPDNIYKIDLNTGSKSLIAIPEDSTTVESMSVSEDGSILYITDKNTQNIKSIKLK